MRKTTMLILAGGLLGATANAAGPTQATPDQIICAVSGSCDDSGPDASQRMKAGDEKAFSLALPNSGAPASHAATVTTTRTTVTTTRRRPVYAAARTGAAVRRADGSVDMNLTFELGSANLTQSARSQASAFAVAMRSPQLSAMRFAIEGHTDAIGGRDYNLDLSQKRAQAVVDYLVGQGIDGGRLEAKGYGFDKPLPGTSAKSPLNRRVGLVKQG